MLFSIPVIPHTLNAETEVREGWISGVEVLKCFLHSYENQNCWKKILKCLESTLPPPSVIGLTSPDNKVFFSVKMRCVNSNREGEREYAYLCVYAHMKT